MSIINGLAGLNLGQAARLTFALVVLALVPLIYVVLLGPGERPVCRVVEILLAVGEMLAALRGSAHHRPRRRRPRPGQPEVRGDRR